MIPTNSPIRARYVWREGQEGDECNYCGENLEGAEFCFGRGRSLMMCVSCAENGEDAKEEKNVSAILQELARTEECKCGIRRTECTYHKD